MGAAMTNIPDRLSVAAPPVGADVGRSSGKPLTSRQRAALGVFDHSEPGIWLTSREVFEALGGSRSKSAMSSVLRVLCARGDLEGETLQPGVPYSERRYRRVYPTTGGDA